MPKLIRWNTPFTESKDPSVGLLITTKAEATDVLKAIVAPNGIDLYPKYLVSFGEIVAFTCMEEAYAPKMDFASAEVEQINLCAYEFLDSPWLQSYKSWVPFFTGSEEHFFHHYLIFGGDNNVEIITPNRPTIDVIEQKTILRIEYEL